jgi:hypothetical protein
MPKSHPAALSISASAIFDMARSRMSCTRSSTSDARRTRDATRRSRAAGWFLTAGQPHAIVGFSKAGAGVLRAFRRGA